MSTSLIPRSVDRASLGPELRIASAHCLGILMGAGFLSVTLIAIGHAATSIIEGIAPGHSHAILASSLVLISLFVALCPTAMPLESGRQVPRRWLGWHRLWLTALAFGTMLGFGVLVRMRRPTMYLFVAAVVAVPRPQVAFLACAAYGATRCWIFLRMARTAPHRLHRSPRISRITETPLFVRLAALGFLTFTAISLIVGASDV